MAALVAVVALQVISRYVFKNPIIWTEEAARYMLIIITFLGAPIAVRNGANVSLDFIFSRLSEQQKRPLTLISLLPELFFHMCGIVLSLRMAVFSKGRYLVSVRISRSFIYCLIAAGFAAMLLRGILRFIQVYCGYTPVDYMKTGKEEEA